MDRHFCIRVVDATFALRQGALGIGSCSIVHKHRAMVNQVKVVCSVAQLNFLNLLKHETSVYGQQKQAKLKERAPSQNGKASPHVRGLMRKAPRPHNGSLRSAEIVRDLDRTYEHGSCFQNPKMTSQLTKLSRDRNLALRGYNR